MGLGKRHEPLDNQPVENPGVGQYEMRQPPYKTFLRGAGGEREELERPGWTMGNHDHSKNHIVRTEKKRPNWPGPGDTKLPEFTTNGRKTEFPAQVLDPAMLKAIRDNVNKKEDALGPGSYNIKLPTNVPHYSFGSRFNSSIRNKDHLKPKKVDGPGPGAYKQPDSVQLQRRHKDSVNRTTFGTSERNFIDLPKHTPAPNKYRPVHMTEASHAYSIPRPPEIDHKEA